MSKHSLTYFTYLILGILSLSALQSCNGSKAMTKKGQKLEEAGMYSEAANMYYVALRKKSTNVDAKIGMKSTGQAVLNGMIDRFATARASGNKKDAVYAFREADDYVKKIKGVGVDLNLAEFYRQDYVEVKDAYLNDLYEEGSTLLEAEKYSDAEKLFDEIGRLDPGFRDAGALKDIAYLEPLYNKGVHAADAGKYREALGYFDKVVQRQSDYKDSQDRRKQVIDAGRFPVAVMPFSNATNTSGLDATLSAYTLQALASVDDPFLKVVDRDNLQAILDEQRLGMSGVIDETTAVNVGALTGAKAIVTGTVLTYGVNQGRVRSTEQPGYESYQVKVYNEQEQKYFYETKYRKTAYREYYGESTANLSFQFKMISLETGEVMVTKIIERSERDAVRYTTYEGDAKNLFPATSNGINLNRAARNELLNMMQARRELKTTEQLSTDLYKTVGHELSREIDNALIKAIE